MPRLIFSSYCRLSRGSSNVVFKDFTLEACRGMGILGYDLKNITIENMEVRNTGKVEFERYYRREY